MRQVDEVHDAEDQGQPRRHQEQQRTQLQAVEQLRQQQRSVHRTSPEGGRPVTSAGSPPRRRPGGPSARWPTA
ncbi:hypothetical protein G6F46_015597 [Rhizopus delemar]|nr:hypothetical protein G6F46_015597 [Rhizopus delemar]